MTVERIFTRPASTQTQLEHDRIRVAAGAGIEGDRYFDHHDEPGQNITLVEAEEIESFLNEHGRPYDLSITGRNVVTRGVRLNELVGKDFFIGTVRFRGVELCEPCLGLGTSLQSGELSPADAVRHWVHRAGLRADALSSGEIALGATVRSDA
jgi:MOSC domain-containing protein YiiM